MAKFEVGQRVRIKVGKRTGEEGTVNSLPGVGHQSFTNYLLDTSDGELLYMESELEPIIDFQPGDIVRAEKGDSITQDALRTIGSIETLWLREWRLSDYEEKGYTLTLVKRPEPEIVLPTKQGMYFATEHKKEQDEKWHSDGKIFFYLNSDGNWIDLGWGQPSVIDGELKAHENE